MTIELEVIDMITSGIIPKMSFQERTQLDKYLLQLITERKDTPLDQL